MFRKGEYSIEVAGPNSIKMTCRRHGCPSPRIEWSRDWEDEYEREYVNIGDAEEIARRHHQEQHNERKQ